MKTSKKDVYAFIFARWIAIKEANLNRQNDNWWKDQIEIFKKEIFPKKKKDKIDNEVKKFLEMESQEIKYKNRQGSIYSFLQIDDNTVKWEGSFMNSRLIYDNPNGEDIKERKIIALDPPGGPFISIGTDLKNYGFKNNFIINNISITNDLDNKEIILLSREQ